MTVTAIVPAVAILLLAAAALHDVASRTVPNWIPAAIFGLGLVVRVLDASALPGFAAALAIFAMAGLCWRRGWLGGADVKLLGASAAVVPPHLALSAIAWVAVAGGVLALVYLALGMVLRPAPAGRRPAGLVARVLRVERYRIARRGPLPYASAIAAGVAFVIMSG